MIGRIIQGFTVLLVGSALFPISTTMKSLADAGLVGDSLGNPRQEPQEVKREKRRQTYEEYVQERLRVERMMK